MFPSSGDGSGQLPGGQRLSVTLTTVGTPSAEPTQETVRPFHFYGQCLLGNGMCSFFFFKSDSKSSLVCLISQ